MENHDPELDGVFHALADPTRRAVVGALATCETATVKELAAPLSMGLPAFLKHLKILEDCGLIATTKLGRVRICSLRSQRFTQAEHWLTDRRREVAARLRGQNA